MELERRVARLEDRAEINDLVVRYFLAADGDDLKIVGECFTGDATFASSGVESARGRHAIIDFIRTSRELMGLTIHTPNYVQVTFDGPDNARGLVGAHLELVIGGKAIYGAVRYVDTYIRQDGGWLIASRDMRTLYIAPWADAGDAFGSDTPVRWPGAAGGPSDYPRTPVS